MSYHNWLSKKTYPLFLYNIDFLLSIIFHSGRCNKQALMLMQIFFLFRKGLIFPQIALVSVIRGIVKNINKQLIDKIPM